MMARTGPGSRVGSGLLARDDAFWRHQPGDSPAGPIDDRDQVPAPQATYCPAGAARKSASVTTKLIASLGQVSKPIPA